MQSEPSGGEECRQSHGEAWWKAVPLTWPNNFRAPMIVHVALPRERRKRTRNMRTAMAWKGKREEGEVKERKIHETQVSKHRQNKQYMQRYTVNTTKQTHKLFKNVYTNRHTQHSTINVDSQRTQTINRHSNTSIISYKNQETTEV